MYLKLLFKSLLCVLIILIIVISKKEMEIRKTSVDSYCHKD